MEEVLKNIIEKYGEEILLSNKKFVSIFADTAPQLKNEKKLLEMALNENIGPLFVNCEKKQRSTIIIKARRKLENNYMSETGINEFLAGITFSLGWTEEYNTLKNHKNVQKKIETEVKEKKKEEPKKVVTTENNEIISQETDSEEKKKTNWKVATIASLIGGVSIVIIDGRESFALNLYNFISGIIVVFFAFISMHIAKKLNKGKAATGIIAFVIWYGFLMCMVFISNHVQLWEYLLEKYE